MFMRLLLPNTVDQYHYGLPIVKPDFLVHKVRQKYSPQHASLQRLLLAKANPKISSGY